MTNFESLGLHPALAAMLAKGGYAQPTPIQAQAIPQVLEGRDVLGLAQTGTGKTAAFGLPILHRLIANPKPRVPRGCRALILAPTRELAAQIAQKLRVYGDGHKLRVECIFGGVKISNQIRAMQGGCDILVATPGRLLDHMSQNTLSIGQAEIVVVDEADQMMDLGFVNPLRKIARALPKGRQTLFFSATMPVAIRELADEFLRNPVEVAVTPVAKTADRVEQKIIHVATSAKRALLADILKDADVTRALVFTRTKHGADKVVRALDSVRIPSVALHGNKSQAQRIRALESFKLGHARVLVATDIAARGIHVDEVSHVINFDMPVTPEAYVHRIGRTARAGAEGIAISFCAPEERGELRDIEKLTRQTIPSEKAGPLDALPEPAPQADREERRERPQRGGGRPPRAEGPADRARRPAPHGRDDRTESSPRGERFERSGAPSGERRPYGNRDGQPAGERRPYGNRDGQPAGERRPYGNRDGQPAGERRPYGNRDGQPAGERRPYGNRDGQPSGERRPYGNRDGQPSGERRPYGNRDSQPAGERRPYGDRDGKPGRSHEGAGMSHGPREGKPAFRGGPRSDAPHGDRSQRPPSGPRKFGPKPSGAGRPGPSGPRRASR